MNWFEGSQVQRRVEQEETQLAAQLNRVQVGQVAAATGAGQHPLRQRLKVLRRLHTALGEITYAREAAPLPHGEDLRRLADILSQFADLAGADGLADLLQQIEAILARIKKSAPVAANPPIPAPGQALVTHVADGDSFTVAGGWRVRCIGIDSPELRGDDQRPEPFALEARGALRAMIEGHTVRLVADQRSTDRYGRLLRYVYLQDTLINAEMLRLGYAVALAVRPNVKYQQEFEKIEGYARQSRRGIWCRID